MDLACPAKRGEPHIRRPRWGRSGVIHRIPTQSSSHQLHAPSPSPARATAAPSPSPADATAAPSPSPADATAASSPGRKPIGVNLTTRLCVYVDLDLDLDLDFDYLVGRELSQTRCLSSRSPLLATCSRNCRQSAATIRGYVRPASPCIPFHSAEYRRGIRKEQWPGPAPLLYHGPGQCHGMCCNHRCMPRFSAHRTAARSGSGRTPSLRR